MDENAIEKIRELEAAASDRLPEDVAGRAIILPNRTDVQDLERFLPHRTRFRALFSTNALNAYLRYLESRILDGQVTGTPIVTIEPDDYRTTAYLNLGTQEQPGHGDDKTIFIPDKTAAFKALQWALEKTFDQRELAEWLEEWGEHITPLNRYAQSDGEAVMTEPVALSRAVSVVRGITVEQACSSTSEVEDFGETRSSMASINAKSKNGISLPWGLYFECIPTSCHETRIFTIKLAVITGDSGLLFKLRMQQKERIYEEMSEEFRGLVENAVGSTVGEEVTVLTGALYI